MKRIPKGRDVEETITALAREVTSSLEELSQQAAKLLSRGDCTGAEKAVKMGRSISEFRAKVEQLRKEWRALRNAARPKRNKASKATPVWEYYTVIAKALVRLGGEADWEELEKELAPLLDARLKPADLWPNSRGVPRWKSVAKRARKPMIREGFLEEATKRRWKITDAARHLAERDRDGDSGE